MAQQVAPFTNKSLKAMIIPLFLEQLLVMLVGLADTLIVSYVGEAAVSGVSLVNPKLFTSESGFFDGMAV